MNSGVLINGAIGLYCCYSIYRQIMSQSSTANVYGITMNKWIFVAILAALAIYSFNSVFKFLKAKNRVR